MTQTEKRKIRGTNRGLVRGQSRRTTDFGRLKDSEYADMGADITKKVEQTHRNMRKWLYEDNKT